MSDEEDLGNEEEWPLQALDSFDADLGRVIGSLTDAIENSVASEQDGEELSNLSKRALQVWQCLISHHQKLQYGPLGCLKAEDVICVNSSNLQPR